MDGFSLFLFIAATFVGGLTGGLAGFATGLVVSGVWLHILPPAQTATLIVLGGFVTQGYGIWQVRRAIAWRGVWPFIVGGAVGIPIGTALLTTLDAEVARVSIGVLLTIYSLYSLARPATKRLPESLAADIAGGVLNGVVGGLTGLTGLVIAVWCQLRGGSNDAQRAVYQPVIFAAFLMNAVAYGFAGLFTVETLKLYLLALPALILGVWCGVRLYGKLDERSFRRMILLLLLASGLALVVPALWRAGHVLLGA
ncbi:MAG: sulfite exporter TauE/SafE family protein [Alphaproteobacteria bacterium]|nr:sulfite exporter TauE/SafE family protein [Alphaproteobacteria bacterium]